MAEEGTFKDKPIGLSRDDKNDSERQADAGTYVPALIFGSVALPKGISPARAAFIEASANSEQRFDTTGMTIGNVGGGSLGMKTKEERQREADENSDAYLSVALAEVERQAEREREHERQWLQSSHTYAGQTLTGEEWREMSDWFRDDKNMAAWEDAMMAETGDSLEEVRKTGGKMKRFYDLMDKDARGTLSKNERQEFDTLQKDRDVKRGVEVQQDIQAAQRNEVGLTAKSEITLDGSQKAMLETRNRLNQDDTALRAGLASVAPLSPTYREAALGLTKPDTSVAPPPAAPVAANTVQISPDNMFG